MLSARYIQATLRKPLCSKQNRRQRASMLTTMDLQATLCKPRCHKQVPSHTPNAD
jgi:hypothetical protein